MFSQRSGPSVNDVIPSHCDGSMVVFNVPLDTL